VGTLVGTLVVEELVEKLVKKLVGKKYGQKTTKISSLTKCVLPSYVVATNLLRHCLA
jgi:hypothetical protein